MGILCSVIFQLTCQCTFIIAAYGYVFVSSHLNLSAITILCSKLIKCAYIGSGFCTNIFGVLFLTRHLMCKEELFFSFLMNTWWQNRSQIWLASCWQEWRNGNEYFRLFQCIKLQTNWKCVMETPVVWTTVHLHHWAISLRTHPRLFGMFISLSHSRFSHKLSNCLRGRVTLAWRQSLCHSASQSVCQCCQLTSQVCYLRNDWGLA